MSNKILLVDDELHILRAAEFKLTRAGYDVDCATNGEMAWEYLKESLPDVVVTDLQMPRMNGLELIEKIRSDPDTAHLPVLMLTAKGFEIPREETSKRLEIFDIIAKPFSPRDLCKRIQIALEDCQRNREMFENPAR